MFTLIQCLCEISQICYSNYEKRNPRQILRHFNLTFKFHTLSRSVIGIPKKLTQRKFYGTHFHTLTIDCPEIYRILCLKSIIPEYEERTFGDIRSLTISSSNRHPQHIIGNAILRLHGQEQLHQSRDSVKLQDSMISKQARLLPKSTNTIFTEHFIKTHRAQFESHLKRISNFLLPGINVWWKDCFDGVEFMDSSSEPASRNEGSTLHHFRASNLKS